MAVHPVLFRRSLVAAVVFALAWSTATAVASSGEVDATGEGEPSLNPNQVITIAGTGEEGYSGDGADARDARLGRSLNGGAGRTNDDIGDGGPPVDASIWRPRGIVVDSRWFGVHRLQRGDPPRQRRWCDQHSGRSTG